MTTHAPNTPRTRNARGQKVDEPVQCVSCLTAWPCDVVVLAEDIARLQRENQALRSEIDGLREEVRCFEANIGEEGLDR